jgi:hypothetical protein
MQQMLILPVANGILPRPEGGRVKGLFNMDQGGRLLLEAGAGHDVLLCPWMMDAGALYPIGVIGRIIDISLERAADESGREIAVAIAAIEGRGHARWHFLEATGPFVFSRSVERMDFRVTRKEYPSVSGAGWVPAGGYTEFRGKDDIPVTIYGTDIMSGHKVSMTANLGGLVSEEHAHTIEHAMIRALNTYGLCTARTLTEAMAKETKELKASVENSIRFTMPEILGVTESGSCGNQMTNLAQFYLAQEFVEQVAAGKTALESLAKARKTAMSQLTQDLGLTMQQGLRVLQGLKKGMSHDDTPLKIETCKKVIRRFPLEPWS